MKNINSILFLIFTLGLLTFSCVNHSDKQESQTEGGITVTDFRGKKLIFNKPVERIVCLVESALSGIFMLNEEKRLAGISTNVYDESVYSQYSALDSRIKNKTLPAPGNWDFVNIENIVALNPDLVIIWASQNESVQSIESKGIPVYAVMLKNTEDIYKEISDFGLLTNKKSRADSLISYTKRELVNFSKIGKSKIPEKKSVYFMWSQGPLETSGLNSTVNELIEMAGAKNACTMPDEHIVVNLERVIEWNPDKIVMWNNSDKSTEDILNLSSWSKIRAIKDKQVYELPSVFLCDLWTLKFQYAVKLLSTWCYPDKFSDVDLEKEKQKMLFNLYGIEGEFIK